MQSAKHAVLFLAFDPGNNSILDVAGKLLKDKPDLFVRGALTSPVRATNFSAALHAGGHSEGPAEEGADDDATPKVKVVGESGTPKKEGAKGSIDFRGVPAGAVGAKDAFGKWETELAKYGFAIIHNKIVVIDPFSDDCVVVTGSHNLGFRASHNNDENMLIIRGHRGLAEAYACHVLDLYDHYAWRFLLKQHPDIFGKPLQGDDTWQERYIKGAEEKSPELRFWMSAAGGSGGGSSTGVAVAGGGATAGKKKPSASGSSKTTGTPAKSKTAKAPTKPAKKAPKKAAVAAKSSAGRKTTKKKAVKKASKTAQKKTVAAKKAKAKANKKASKKTSRTAAKKVAKTAKRAKKRR